MYDVITLINLQAAQKAKKEGERERGRKEKRGREIRYDGNNVFPIVLSVVRGILTLRVS